jgi:hypothetical protein
MRWTSPQFLIWTKLSKLAKKDEIRVIVLTEVVKKSICRSADISEFAHFSVKKERN